MFFVFQVGVIVAASDYHMDVSESIRRQLRLQVRQRLQRQPEILFSLETIDREEESFVSGKQVLDRRIDRLEKIVEDERRIQNFGVD